MRLVNKFFAVITKQQRVCVCVCVCVREEVHTLV